MLFLGDCLNGMRAMDAESVDLTVTSPPYDNLRDYENLPFSKFKEICREIYRVSKPGAVCVWVVGDAVIDGSETGTSFRQALEFLGVGFRLHDTMIYEKSGFSFPMNTRYHQIFEYMFVFSKGSPKAFNPIKDYVNKSFGAAMRGTERQRDGTLKPLSKNDKEKTIQERGLRRNIWRYNTGAGHMSEESFSSFTHPAMFPLRLAEDHIISWSNPGDLVLDPFSGSGTTGVAAKFQKRQFLGFEKSPEYFALSEERISKAVNEDVSQPSLFTEVAD